VGNKGPNADHIASLEYDLVDSAMAFLTRSVQTMGDDSSDHTAAFAIADLATAVEVLMKARLGSSGPFRHSDGMQQCHRTGRRQHVGVGQKSGWSQTTGTDLYSPGCGRVAGRCRTRFGVGSHCHGSRP